MIEKVQESFKNLEYRVAGHDPGSLPELRSAAGEGGVQEAGVAPMTRTGLSTVHLYCTL